MTGTHDLCDYERLQMEPCPTSACLVKKSWGARWHLSVTYVGVSLYSKHTQPPAMKQLSKTTISGDERTTIRFCLGLLMLLNSSLIVQSASHTANEQMSQLGVQTHLHKHNHLHARTQGQTRGSRHTDARPCSISLPVIEIIVRQSGEGVAGNEGLYIKASAVDIDRIARGCMEMRKATHRSQQACRILACACVRVKFFTHPSIHPSSQPASHPSVHLLYLMKDSVSDLCVCLCLCLGVCVCARVIPLMIPHGEQARGRCDTPDVILYFFFLLCIPPLPPDRRTNMHIKHVHAHKQIYKPLRTCSRNCLGCQRNTVNNELIDDQLWENVFGADWTSWCVFCSTTHHCLRVHWVFGG